MMNLDSPINRTGTPDRELAEMVKLRAELEESKQLCSSLAGELIEIKELGRGTIPAKDCSNLDSLVATIGLLRHDKEAYKKSAEDGLDRIQVLQQENVLLKANLAEVIHTARQYVGQEMSPAAELAARRKFYDCLIRLVVGEAGSNLPEKG